MSEQEERNSNKLQLIDQMYGYEQPITEEDEENKSLAQQMTDSLKRRRERAFGQLRGRV